MEEPIYTILEDGTILKRGKVIGKVRPGNTPEADRLIEQDRRSGGGKKKEKEKED